MAGSVWPWIHIFWTHRKLDLSSARANIITLRLISFLKKKKKDKCLMILFVWPVTWKLPYNSSSSVLHYPSTDKTTGNTVPNKWAF